MIAAVRRIGRFFPLAACVKVALLQSLLSLTLLCGQLSAAWAEQTDRLFRVGVTAFRDKAATQREWTPTIAYLNSTVKGAYFEVVPMVLAEFQGALARNQLDFIITNPEHYIVFEAQHGFSRVATLVKGEKGKPVNQFGGVIFTKSDRADIQHLADLKTRTIAATDKTSFAGYLLQADLLETNDVNLDSDAKVKFLGFPQDLNVKAVLSGQVDVGFVRSGLIESMVEEGLVNKASLKVINAWSPPDYPFQLSTPLFPEWPLAVAPHVPMEVANQVVASLLLMPAGSEASRSARYYRWSSPVEYLSVERLMRRRHIYPFDQPEPVRVVDLLRQHAIALVAMTLAIALTMAVLYLRARRLNIDLQVSRTKLRELAHHDVLTGLPNRMLLDDRVNRSLMLSRRSGKQLAVCLLDLDGFKPVNDQFGHKVGDELLKELAGRLTSSLREGDTVARYGGDEFVLVLNEVPDRAHVKDVLNRVLQAVASPYMSCESAKVTASMGVSLFPADASHAEELYRHADAAMYVAKKGGGNSIAFHQASD
jgi:diguanylate cyclase (GGDEF)-like protein